jgi:hypothetical protein
MAMETLLLASVALIAVSASAAQTSFGPTCAAVLRDAIDVHLKPNTNSEILTRVYGSDILVIDTSPTGDVFKDWILMMLRFLKMGKSVGHDQGRGSQLC